MFAVKKLRNTILGSGLATYLIIFYSLGLLTHNISPYRDNQAIKRKVFPSRGKKTQLITSHHIITFHNMTSNLQEAAMIELRSSYVTSLTVRKSKPFSYWTSTRCGQFRQGREFSIRRNVR